MRRIITFLLSAAIVLCLSPCCFGDELIGKVGAGQLCTIDTRNGHTYRADFLLSSVDALRCSGDDLTVEMGGGSITLTGFFADGRKARQLLFSDGSYISGEDFDDTGAFKGKFFTGADTAKENAEIRRLYAENPEAFLNCCVRQLVYGYEVLKDGYAVFGDEKQLLIGIYRLVFGENGLDMSSNSSNELYLRENDDGTYTPMRQKLSTLNGPVITCDHPDCLAVMSSTCIVPLSEGRAAVMYADTIGETLQTFNAKVYDDNGTLAISTVCPRCENDTAGEIHLLVCGHYSCQSDYDSTAHAVGDCGLAGHCISDGRDHGKCTNCQGYRCDGQAHGRSVCIHVHQWVTTSYTPGDADNPPHSTSTCFICGENLYQ